MYKQIINNTFNSVFFHKETIMKALLIPTLILIVFDYIEKQNAGAIVYVILFLSFLININIAITTHRVLILGKESIEPWGHYKMGNREWSFLLQSFLLGILVGIPAVLLMLIPMVGPFLAVIYAAIIFTRLSPVFPSISIDKPLGFEESWNLTKSYKLLCFLTILIFPVVFTLIVGFIYGLVIGYLAKVISPLFNHLMPILQVFMTVFTISALSHTYKLIIENYKPKQNLQEPDDITIEQRDKTFEILIHVLHPTSFEELKEELIAQYESLGFTKTALDKEDSWMIKNPEDEATYVSLRLKDEHFIIETYNTQKPELSILNENN